jgi:hypothetical protein
MLQGDEWKNTKEQPIVPKRRTRAEAQKYADDEYWKGRITLAEWKKQTDLLSEPRTE